MTLTGRRSAFWLRSSWFSALPVIRRVAFAAVAVATLGTGLTSASAQTITWTGSTSGSQNMASTTTLPFVTPGIYSLTVNTIMTVTFKGVSGGGGGSGSNGSIWSAVISASRPNGATYQGMPAYATNPSVVLVSSI